MNLEKQVNSIKYQKFIENSKKELQPKTFLEKHFKTINFVKFFSYLFSIISVVFGCIAVYSTGLDLIGLNITLLESFNGYGFKPYLLLLVSGLFLSFFEIGKHHFYTQGNLEYYRKTDDFGKREFLIGRTLQAISIVLSFYGGYLAANEIAGTEKAKILYSINKEYEPKLNELTTKIEKYNGKEFKNRQGKTLYKVLPIIEDLESEKLKLEQEYKTAKVNKGVSDGFVAASTLGTNKMIMFLGGSQIVIELILYYCLWWIVYLKSQTFFDLENSDSKDLDNSKKDVDLKDTPIFDTNTLVLNEDTGTKKIGFDYPNKDTNELKHNINSEVSQHKHKHTSKHTSKHTDINAIDKSKYIDIENEKKRVRQYVPRINNTYTKTRFERLQQDIKKLAKAGYRVSIKKDGKVSIKKDDTITSKVLIQYSFGKIEIQYL